MPLSTWVPAVAALRFGSLPTANLPSWLVSKSEMARRGSRIAASAAFAICSAMICLPRMAASGFFAKAAGPRTLLVHEKLSPRQEEFSARMSARRSE